MGITKSDAGTVVVPVDFQKKVLQPDGTIKEETIKTVWLFRKQRKLEADEEGRALARNETVDGVKKAASLILKEPTGFEDFPKDERPLVDRFIEYFSDDDMRNYAEWALSFYYKEQRPINF